MNLFGLKDLRWGKRAEKIVAKELKQKYPYVFHLNGPHPFDILAIDEKEIFFCEVKTGKAKQTLREEFFEEYLDLFHDWPQIRYGIIRKPGLKDRLKSFFG